MHEREILLAALDKSRPEERESYLAEACGADLALRSRVDALLRAAEVQDSFLERPAFETELLNLGKVASSQGCMRHDDLSLHFLQPSDDPQALGRLGYYDVLEVLGQGGFGVVFKARDTKLDRIVAIKTLAQSLASSATARKRFVREAKAAAAVKHDNVVGIYHVADEGPVPFLVMECISGASLEAKLQHVGTLDLPAILRIGMQIASGLAAAHQQGLVHRDVKPGNILLENGVERVKITDFGLARTADDAALTRTGEVAGTPQFMSPEQAQGLPLDARSDLFSLGSVLYAMATGRSPFRAESTVAALRRVCDDTPRPIREINGDIPEWLQTIISRLLAKQPSERFQTATEVAELLGQYLAHVQQPAIVQSPKPAIASPRQPSAIASRHWTVALIALAAMACIMGLTEAAGVTQVVPTVIRIVRGEGTLVIEVDDPTVQVSLDGESLSIRGAGLQELRLLPGEYRLHATKNGQPIKDEVVTISRDGRKVVTVTREESDGSVSASSAPAADESVGELKLLANLSGHANIVHAVSFLPDGQRMVSVDQNTRVRTWDLETRSVLSTFDLRRGYCSAADVSADGRFVATITDASDARSRMICVWNLENRKQICDVAQQNFDYLTFIRFSPDGTRVVASGKPSTGVLWDILTGKEVQRFEVDEPQTHAVEFSPDGRLLAMGGENGRVRLFDAESGDVLGDAHLPAPRAVISLAFTPGGDSLACGQMGGHTNVVAVKSRQVTASLTDSKPHSHVVSLRFLDNERLLLTRFDGSFEVWDLARTKIVATAVSEPVTTKRLALSPDGRYAVAASGQGWDVQSKSRMRNGDYALRLWQLPESVWPKEPSSTSSAREQMSVSSDQGAFVLLAAGEERKYDALGEAVSSAKSGDTIEVRGNGPFLTDTIQLRQPLILRAGHGFRPVIRLTQAAALANEPLIHTTSNLVLEGMVLERLGDDKSLVVWPSILDAADNASLFVANCRLVTNFGRCFQVGKTGTLRNCEFLTPSKGYTCTWTATAHGQGVIDNCISSGRIANFDPRALGMPSAKVRLSRNTTFGPVYLEVRDVVGLIHDDVPLQIDASSNVFGHDVLVVHQRSGQSPAANETEAIVPRFLQWNEMQNVYPQDAEFFTWSTAQYNSLSTMDALSKWNDWWQQGDAAAVQGAIRFAGGDLKAKARINLDQLTAADFRLHPDSAGHRAGPDGKDLGADVDFVGAGEAYERWQQTPEYQQWLKETGQQK